MAPTVFLHGQSGVDAGLVSKMFFVMKNRTILKTTVDISAPQSGGELILIFEFPSNTLFTDGLEAFQWSASVPQRIIATRRCKICVSIQGNFTRGRSNCTLYLQKNGQDLIGVKTQSVVSSNYPACPTNFSNTDIIQLDMNPGDYLSIKGVAIGGNGDGYTLSAGFTLTLREVLE